MKIGIYCCLIADEPGSDKRDLKGINVKIQVFNLNKLFSVAFNDSAVLPCFSKEENVNAEIQ